MGGKPPLNRALQTPEWRAARYPANRAYIMRHNPTAWDALSEMADLSRDASRDRLLSGLQMDDVVVRASPAPDAAQTREKPMTRQAARAVLALAALCCAHAARADGTTAATAAPAKPEAPMVAPRADQLLREMGAYLASADEFTIRAEVTFDHVLPTGQKLQFGAIEDMGVRRPNQVYVDWRSDLGERKLWYDGTAVTIVDPSTPFYAVQPAPADLDATLDMVENDLGFSPPLGDLLYADPYRTLSSNVRYGVYLGTSEIAGRECHSLAFVDSRIDWQIWIATGPQPVPCKLLITYLDRPGKPQFSAVFTGWDFAPRIAPAAFAAELQPGAQKIPFKYVQAAAGKKS